MWWLTRGEKKVDEMADRVSWRKNVSTRLKRQQAVSARDSKVGDGEMRGKRGRAGTGGLDGVVTDVVRGSCG